jgi:hypothetical protein
MMLRYYVHDYVVYEASMIEACGLSSQHSGRCGAQINLAFSYALSPLSFDGQ